MVREVGSTDGTWSEHEVGFTDRTESVHKEVSAVRHGEGSTAGTVEEGIEGKWYTPVVLQVSSVRLLLELVMPLAPPSNEVGVSSNIRTA